MAPPAFLLVLPAMSDNHYQPWEPWPNGYWWRALAAALGAAIILIGSLFL